MASFKKISVGTAERIANAINTWPDDGNDYHLVTTAEVLSWNSIPSNDPERPVTYSYQDGDVTINIWVRNPDDIRRKITTW